jgi:hypothetical protein
MSMSDAMRAELDRRLAELDAEPPAEAAARELPAGDARWLAVLLVAALVGVAIQQYL